MMEDEDAMDEGPSERAVNQNRCDGSDWVHFVPTGVDKRDLPLKDISSQAVWTLSSCKTDGYGVNELLDDSVDKYWQSDGPQPHTISVEFQKKTDFCFLCLYLDYKNDESYTPSKVFVHLGSSLMHLDEGREHTFHEPCGWQIIDLRGVRGMPSRAMVLQLHIVHNHQNGRDTHVRHVRVVGPCRSRFSVDNRLAARNPANNVDFRIPSMHSLNDRMTGAMIIR